MNSRHLIRCSISLLDELFYHKSKAFAYAVDKLPGVDVVGPPTGWKINCFEEALAINRAPNELVDSLCQKIGFAEEPSQGMVAWYFQNDKPVHAGVVSEPGKIVSRWGKGGWVFVHPEWYVPLSYGSTIKYSEKPAKNLIDSLR